MHIQDENKLNNKSFVDCEQGTGKGGTLDCHWKNCGLDWGGKFSLVTGGLRTTQKELLQRVFNVLNTWHFLNTGRL